MRRRPRCIGSYPKQALYRIGKEDARKLIGEGWRLAAGLGLAYELIDPKGYAVYWLARNAARQISEAASAAGEE